MTDPATTFLHGKLADHDGAEGTQKKDLFYEPRLEITSGEERLMMAMLEDVITLLVKEHARNHTTWRNWLKRAQTEARTWVESDEHDFIFSFRFICEHFGFSVNAVRKKILEQPQEVWENIQRQRVTAGRKRGRSNQRAA